MFTGALEPLEALEALEAMEPLEALEALEVLEALEALEALQGGRVQRQLQVAAALRQALRHVARHALAGPGLRVEGAQALLLGPAAARARAHALRRRRGRGRRERGAGGEHAALPRASARAATHLQIARLRHQPLLDELLRVHAEAQEELAVRLQLVDRVHLQRRAGPSVGSRVPPAEVPSRIRNDRS